MNHESPGRRIAISDIHGCGDTFETLLNQLNLSLADQLYLLGDFIDRGPAGQKVLDIIMAYQADHYQVYCLKGNHEDMLLKGIEDPYTHALWAQANGGNSTLESFGVNHASELSGIYLAFFRALHYYIELENLLLVHAGFNFKAPAPFQDVESMLWIRHFQPVEHYTRGRKIIHGHTPVPFAEIRQSVEAGEPAINIDNGCAYPMPGLQGLVALDLDTFQLWRQPNRES